ncbi:MAG: FAD-binding oxidoreductase [Pseudomonadota bacterium]
MSNSPAISKGIEPTKAARPPVPAEAWERLRRAVGPKNWFSGDEDTAPFLTEWRGRYHGAAAMVLRPADTVQVQSILRTAHEFHIPVVPQGGHTGLVGGAMPDDSGAAVVINLSRLTGVRSIDPENYAMVVNAGAVLADVQDAATEAERLFPMSLSSEGSAQIGGLIATNAGGVHVVKYGNMRDLVLGLEVVLPDGTRLDDLSALRKDNTGYDLKQLFIGSEGTLGIITAASLKLMPANRSQATALAAIANPRDAVALMGLARELTGDLVTAFELMPRNGVDLVLRHIPAAVQPFATPPPWMVLIDLASPQRYAALSAAMERLLTRAFDEGLIADAVIGDTVAKARALWNVRHHFSAAQKAEGASIKHDISVPISAISEFITKASRAVVELIPGARPVPFGHIGDGNIHFNISQPEAMAAEAFLAREDEVHTLVYEIVDSLGGSISAEHGIGQMKVGILPKFKSPAHIATMKAIKAAIDPHNIMNPGKLVSGS